MAGSPRWKVYSAEGDYRAACKYPEEAAAVVSVLGDGATIRAEHGSRWTVWTEGKDGVAGDSFDVVAEVCHTRRDERAVQAAKGMVNDRRRRESITISGRRT